MRKIIIHSGIILLLTCACGIKDHQQDNDIHSIPQIINDGKVILFPDIQSISFFKTEPVGSALNDPTITATARTNKSEGNLMSIDTNSLVKVGEKNYVFVKRGTKHFERTEIKITNQIRNRILVYSGLTNGDLIATEGVMQLKEYSFNY